MSSMMSMSIPVEKLRGIPKTKDKNGKEYFNLTIAVNDDADKYGNNVSCMVAQSKEERDAKTPKIYIGNGKVFWGYGKINENDFVQEQKIKHAKTEPDDDLPF